MQWVEAPPTNWISTEKQIIECVKYLKTKKDICADIESSGLSIINDYPIMFSLSDGVERFGAMADAMQHPDMKGYLEGLPHLINSNILIDVHWMANVGVMINGGLMNTVTMDWLLDENREGRHGLKECALDYCGIRMREFKEVFPMKRGESAKDAILRKISDEAGFKEARQYAGLDAYANWHVYDYLKGKLSDIDCFDPTENPDGSLSRWTLWDYFVSIEVPFARLLWNLERRGIQVSVGYFKQLESLAEARLKRIEFDIDSLIGYKLNPRSTQQLREYFFKKQGKKALKVTDSGAESVDIEVLKGWASDDPVAKLLVEHRQITKLLGTYIKGLPEAADKNGRIHTTLRGHTVSGRLSSTGPNIQNIPVGEKDIFKIRAGFIAPPGRVLIDVDYSQLELAILAHKSKDPEMLDAVNTGKDLHLYAVSKIYKRNYDQLKEVKKKGDQIGYPNLTTEEKKIIDTRSSVKRVWYGCIYGQGNDLLGKNLTDDFRGADPSAKSKQCPLCHTIYPIDWEEDCEHINWIPVFNKWTDKRTFVSKKKLPEYLKDVKSRLADVADYIVDERLTDEGKYQRTALVEIRRTVSPVEAQIYVDLLFTEFPYVKEYLDSQVRKVNRDKFVQSLLGRYRRLPAVDSVNYKDKLEAERQGKNSIQNDASDIMKMAMIDIENDPLLKSLGTIMLLQVHDELILECDEDEEKMNLSCERIQFHMENAFNDKVFKLKVKLKAKPQIGYDWASVH